MTWILVTNDDGIDAQALVPLRHALTDLAPVRVVVPDIGTLLGRQGDHPPRPLSRSTTVVREGVEMHTCTGFPADCVQLGVNTLFDEPPALVVSGINLGYNHGSAYLQSSGTVGAAMEACLVGVDGLALSAGGDGDFHLAHLGAHRRVPAHVGTPWPRLQPNSPPAMLAAGPLGVTINVNIPDDATLTPNGASPPWPKPATTRLFRQETPPDVYVHDYRGGLHHRSSLDGTDIAAASEGSSAVTPVRSVIGIALPGALTPLLRSGIL